MSARTPKVNGFFRMIPILLIFPVLISAQNSWTTHSPLTAFKQLGFENGGGGDQGGSHHPKSPPYIPYSISDFSDPPPHHKNPLTPHTKNPPLKQTQKGSLADGFQQTRHPNDILSNMGVDLPPEEMLGKKIRPFFLFLFPFALSRAFCSHLSSLPSSYFQRCRRGFVEFCKRLSQMFTDLKCFIKLK